MSSMFQPVEDPSLSQGSQASIPLHEATLDNRLEALTQVALTLLSEVESLRSAQPSRADRKLRLQEEVRRFETDLIRSALQRTGGSQVRAARLLGVKHSTLHAKIKRYKISFSCHGSQSQPEGQNQERAA